MFLTKTSLTIFLGLPVTMIFLSDTSSSMVDAAGRTDRKTSKNTPRPTPSPTSPPIMPPPQAQAVMTGSVRVVEVKNAAAGGDIFFGLATNFLTQQPSLVGGQLITTAKVFRTEDIVVEGGAIVGDIDFEKQAGFTNNVCTITSGTFDPLVIETAQCTTTTCFPMPDELGGEQCFFSQFGGTLNIDAEQLTLGVNPSGVVMGGTGVFAGVAGSFAITSLVEEPFPPPDGVEEIINVLEVQFALTDYNPALALSGLF